MSRNGAGTRTQILDAAQDLVLAQGFAGTSVDAIIGRAGLTKGAFFHHFRSKQELALALVERYAAADVALLERSLERAERLSRDPLQQLLILVGLYEEIADGLPDPTEGCLFASYLYEAQLFEREVLEVIRRSVEHWRARLGEKLRQVAEKYPPRLPVELEDVADMATVMVEGAWVMAKTTRDRGMLQRQFRQYRNYLELLFSAA